MFTVFTHFRENKLRRCFHPKPVFIRNDKSKLTIKQNWIKAKTKILNRNINSSMKPQSLRYRQVQYDSVEKKYFDRSEFQFEYFNCLESEGDKF